MRAAALRRAARAATARLRSASVSSAGPRAQSASPAWAISSALALPCPAIGSNISTARPHATASSAVAPPALVTTTSAAAVSAGISEVQPSVTSRLGSSSLARADNLARSASLRPQATTMQRSGPAARPASTARSTEPNPREPQDTSAIKRSAGRSKRCLAAIFSAAAVGWNAATTGGAPTAPRASGLARYIACRLGSLAT